ncbi:MAG TPA: acyl-[ACP]--phospholipid O-acyltransferase [Stellaceae bacterium]|nr:acyl-[ACP]--phospholipid O-acyltransferase [Stellaceae bacterium]
MGGSLLASRRFAPLFWCQLFSAFNDNFLKNALALLILFQISGQSGEALVSLAGGVFIAPFFLFSAFGGQVADRFDKALVARRLKLCEIAAAAVAAAGFELRSLPLLFTALFLFGGIGALFGPIKYGILPDHLRREELPRGNALIESATFFAILGGTIAGGLVMQRGGEPTLIAAAMLLFSLLCWGASVLIPSTGRAAPSLVVDPNVLRSTGRLIAELWSDTRQWRCAVSTSIFWMIGAVVLSLLPPLAMRTLHGAEIVVTVYLTAFAIAVALGSGLAAFFAAGRIVLLPVVVGSALIGLAALDLAVALALLPPAPISAALPPGAFFAQPIAWRSVMDLAVVAVGGGLMIVPSFAALQAWAAPQRRARTIAAVNVLNAAFMVAGALVVALLQKAGVTITVLMFGISATGLGSAVWIAATLPTSAFRDFLSIVLRAFYRLEVRGVENFDRAGRNPIVALNHVSFLDAAVGLAILPTEPVFAIDRGIAQRWWVKPFLKVTRAMPLDPTRPLATRTLINAVRGGAPLVIFPEGRITMTGHLMKVYDGAALIAEKSGAPIVPVRIEGLEATIFSHLDRKQVRRRWLPKVRVTVLEPVYLKVDPALKGRARRQAAGAALYQVMSDLIFRTTDTERTIPEAIVAAARLHGWGRIAVEDPVSGRLSYRRLLIAARVLGRRFAALAGAGEALGVMLPSSNAAALTVLGTLSAGRVPAMINFTAGAANILAGCGAAEVKTIVTARGFVERAKLERLVEALAESIPVVYLEDIRASISLFDRAEAMFRHRRVLVRSQPGDHAVILFTSGSEGTPKGVVLSHRNVLANAAQATARIDFGRTDKVFNVLPVFHAFGLTVGLVMPLVFGVPVFLYPSPLHYRIVPELVYGANATILFGTDTFLAGYAQAAHPYDFRSLRYVLAGAEPVKEATRRVWSEKFGLRILEGYGVTEAAPALAINTPMFSRPGTVGRFLPGIEVRLEAVSGIAEGGRLFVRGPNVMQGYLKLDRPGMLQPTESGWHDTGDIVTVDNDGFVTIKGRAKRFAKIGGEMISLTAVEALAAELWPNVLSAVATQPDPRRGERLVLVTETTQATLTAFRAHLRAKGAADLMVPAEVMVVDKLPLLGSGKIDLVAVARLVRDLQPAPALSAG